MRQISFSKNGISFPIKNYIDKGCKEKTMFREKIKVLDCTIRDGGLINSHYFDIRFVREV